MSGSPEVRARNHGRRKSGCDPLVHLRMPSQANAANAQLERLTARTVPSYRSFSIWERFRLASIVSPRCPLSSPQNRPRILFPSSGAAPSALARSQAVKLLGPSGNGASERRAPLKCSRIWR